MRALQEMEVGLGRRGEGWVAIQVVIFIAIYFAPRCCGSSFPIPVRMVGWGLLALAGLLALWGFIALGRNLTPFPKPVDNNRLVLTGPFAVVRHPIYTGVIFGSLGWSLGLSSLPGIALSLLLYFFFDLKSRREEAWLLEIHPEYSDYKNRVRKLIPFIH